MKSRIETWREWRSLVNMTPRELRAFLDKYGKVAGLSRAQAASQGIRSGRDSARALIRMLPKGGRSYSQAEANWSAGDWKWARRQVSFIRRMSGSAGALYDDKGRPTRKLLALLVWGHNPRKGSRGGGSRAAKGKSVLKGKSVDALRLRMGRLIGRRK